MNHSFRLFAVLSLTLVCLPGFAADTVIDQLYGLRKYELADAYYAAGQRFADLGQADRAAEFKAEAKHILPGYVPGQAPPAVAAAPPPPEPQLPSVQVVLEKNLQGEKIARFQFQKLLRGYLTGNADTVTSVLADGLTVQGSPADPSSVAGFLKAHPAEAGSPEELFVLDSLKATDGPGQSVVISVKANPEAPGSLSGLLPFWKDDQSYTFDRDGNTWKLSKIEGQ